ncbi:MULTISPECIES: hypothetical protein [Arcobacteraceae]|uniref:DNA-binding protein n=1 Tax=Malaciobacter mytili LMG 24559 TaxID=1032238 RepID=A0AAX2AJL9_9BACT|nr:MULTISPECIES: hypothetical protein [Arcobacteraceae]AXH13741.1 putative DNA-binding protein [Malaciobacter mytili LMG 24559]RXJ93743.1 hypothetical protein CRV00_09790 [Malaciobacter molluscorum]RXK16350.1 hypothetical protein CP985_04125 [Malaciobacter mytili LMG 24559]
MKLNFEALEQIPQIYQLLNQLNEKVENRVEKKWLSTLETAHYLGYSKDSIDSMVKKNEFIQNIHYYQNQRKRMFDKQALDNWVKGITQEDTNNKQLIDNTIEEIISSLAA